MKRLYDPDNPILDFLSKIADLVILNFLILISCIPVVTIGAALTAGHYAALKIVRNENYVIKNYLKSFKENFLQATIIWIIILVHAVIAVLALFATSEWQSGIPAIFRLVVVVGLIISFFMIVWIFPLQSKFVNTALGTFKNAFLIAYKYFLRTIYMLLVCSVPIVIALFISFRWSCILILIGFSVPIYLCAKTYNKIFEIHEEKIRATAQSW